jgi:hypothetical protein
MTGHGRQHVPKWLVAIAGGMILFASGLATLYLNPYWRSELSQPGVIDHRVHLWNGIGHFLSALGLLCIIVAVACTFMLVLAHQFTGEWLYWVVMPFAICCVTAWLVMHGAVDYTASFHWDSSGGVTAFKVVLPPQEWPNPLWEEIVRWQIEPELSGYLRGGGGSNLERTDGEVAVTVLKTIPIAIPTALGSDGEVLHNVERRKP